MSADPRVPPLMLRSAGELQALCKAPAAVRRLPAAGLKVRIDGLGDALGQRLERRIARYRAACGCGEGAAAALLSLALLLAWLAREVAARGWRWADAGNLAGGVVAALLLAGAAKVVAVRVERWRFERCCGDVLHALATSADSKGEGRS